MLLKPGGNIVQLRNARVAATEKEIESKNLHI
jgi:hypothetical protein